MQRPIYYTQNTLIQKEIARIAILPFDNYTGMETSGTLASNILTVEFMERGYKVVERETLNKLIAEMKLEISGLTTDQSKELASFLKVDGFIIGAVTDYRAISTTTSLSPLPLISFPVTIKVFHGGLSARLIDGKTGEIIWVGSHFESGKNFIFIYCR